MSTYLLTWNPKKYKFDDIQTVIEEIRLHGAVNMTWSTGSRKTFEPGDSFYLMRLGVNPRGIIGYGVATDYVVQEEYWGMPRELPTMSPWNCVLC